MMLPVPIRMFPHASVSCLLRSRYLSCTIPRPGVPIGPGLPNTCPAQEQLPRPSCFLHPSKRTTGTFLRIYKKEFPIVLFPSPVLVKCSLTAHSSMVPPVMNLFRPISFYVSFNYFPVFFCQLFYSPAIFP